MSELINFLSSNNIKFEQRVPLKDISTFKIGGFADMVCFPESAKQISDIVKFCKNNTIDYMSFGRCSNVVFSDYGIKKLIIKTDMLDLLTVEGNYITAGAGVMLAKVSRFSVDCGFKGMEFAYGIPGSLGGAVYMNAGAYGGEMSQIVYKSEYVDENGDIKTLDSEKHSFGYRKSFFSDKSYIITSSTLVLQNGDVYESERLICEFQTARKTKQPLEFPSAGSVFKRPEGYFAGKLIQDCGLKGYSIGGAKVSEKHCGFIINTGNATCDDVMNLVDHIKNSVFETFGVHLECELKFICD